MLKLMETVLSKMSTQINGIERRTLLIEESFVSDNGRSIGETVLSVDEAKAQPHSNGDRIAASQEGEDRVNTHEVSDRIAPSPLPRRIATSSAAGAIAGDGGDAGGGGVSSGDAALSDLEARLNNLKR